MMRYITPWAIVALLLIALSGIGRLYMKERETSRRLDRNVTALTEQSTHYRIGDSISAARIHALEFSLSDMKRRTDDSIRALLDAMDVRLRDTQSITTAQLELNAALSGKLRRLESGLFEYRNNDPHLSIVQTIRPDSMLTDIRIHAPVNLTAVISLDYRIRFWFIRMGYRGARLDVATDNKYVEIKSVSCTVKR